MLELIAAGLFATSEPPPLLRSTNLSDWITQVPLQALLEPQDQPDEAALQDLQAYLDLLERYGWAAEGQSVWFQSGREVLAQHQGKEPLSAASLTKIATTLVALETWGSGYQFVTGFSTTGNLENGVLQGDLIVQGGSNPLFVWEEAIAVANQLQDLGVERVTGQLIVTGPFFMNYELDPIVAGTLLRTAFDDALWTGEVAQQHALMPAGTPRPSLTIDGGVAALGSAQATNLAPRPLVNHYSLSLGQLLKLMNLYSNNFMADLLGDLLGGGAALSRQASELTGVPLREIQLANGSGLGVENRLSARAATAMLQAIQGRLRLQNMGVADVFPVAGLDVGTLQGRDIPSSAAVKTGTLAAVSALAGVLPTRDRGLVWFSIINSGSNLVELRAQQDYLLQDLAQIWGAAALANVPSRQREVLGDPGRVEPLAEALSRNQTITER
ncbi:MAG: D-alanyl-D-alanine carboxypeptidase [Elainellaceae cyanobacterium]